MNPLHTDPFDQPNWSTPAPQAAPQPAAPQTFAPAATFPQTGVTAVSVSWLSSEKVEGQLFSYTASETLTWDTAISVAEATAARAALLARLKAEGAATVAAEVAAYRTSRPTLHAAPTPGHAFTSVHPTTQPYAPPVPQAPAYGTGAAAVAQVAAGAPVGGGWATGHNPKGAEVRYITSTALPTEQFRGAMEQAWSALGYSPAVVGCYDNRIGSRGLESGQRNYSAGAIRLLEEAPGYAQLAAKKKTTVGYAAFNPGTGAVEVKITPDYEQLVETLRSVNIDPFAVQDQAAF